MCGKCLLAVQVSIPHWYNYKHNEDEHVSYGSPLFQFHIGTIISTREFQKLLLPTQFQFHIGTIISTTMGTPWTAAKDVSIPHWYNYKKFARFLKVFLDTVSIPHWYNYKQSPAGGSAGGSAGFQFHIGTIISFKE